MFKPLLFCLCFLACRKTTTNNTNNPVKLNLTECANVQRPAGSIKVCLDSISDSRCPANAICVWAGVAVVKLTVTANSNVHSFKLSTLKSPAFAPNDTTVANHHFQLMNVQPYPGTGVSLVSFVELQVD